MQAPLYKNFQICWFFQKDDISYRLKPKTTIGHSFLCDITIQDNSTPEFHIQVETFNNYVVLRNKIGDRRAFINGIEVSTPSYMYHNDILELGTTEFQIIRKKIPKVHVNGP